MTTELFSDNASTTLTSSPTVGATSFTVASSTGFPAAVTGVSQFRVIIGTEIITVTNVSGTTWTCVATSAAHTSADVVTHVLTAASLGNFVDGKIAVQHTTDGGLYARRRGFVLDVVKDYGAVVDGTTDDTTAWQNAINAVAAAGGGTITSSLQGVSIIGGALQDTSGANAQLLLPSVHALDGKQISITISSSTPPPTTFSVIGVTPLPDGHLVLKSTLNAGVGGSLLGGYGPTGSYLHFTNIFLRLENVAFRMPANPVLSALNLSLVTCVDLDNVVVDAGSYYVGDYTSAPTTTTSYGIRLPANNNGAYTRLGAVNVIGFYNGYEWCEHATGQQVAAWACKQAAVFPAANHASKIKRFMAVHCQKGLVFSGIHYTAIDQLNIEHAASGWWATTADIDDPSNLGHGNLWWHVVLAGVGIDSTFTVNGGTAMSAVQVGAKFVAAPMYADSFNRADSTTTLSSSWEVIQGVWGISTNRAYPVSGAMPLAVMPTTLADCTVQFTVAAATFPGGTDQPGALVRANTGLNGYLIESGNGSTVATIYKAVSGTYTPIATSAGNLQFVTGDIIQVVLLGSLITVKRNGTTVMSVTDTTYTTQTKHGLYAAAPSYVFFDNFSVV